MDDPKVTAGLDSFSLPSVRAHTGGLINSWTCWGDLRGRAHTHTHMHREGEINIERFGDYLLGSPAQTGYWTLHYQSLRVSISLGKTLISKDYRECS